MSGSNCYFLICIRFHRRQVRWSDTPISLRIFHSCDRHSQSLGVVNRQKYMLFWNSLAFSMIQQMLAIWSLVSLPFLNQIYSHRFFSYCTCWTWNPAEYGKHLADLRRDRLFIVIHTVKGFGIVGKAEIDVFLELSCFLHDPTNVGNLISGSSDFSKFSLNIWKFLAGRFRVGSPSEVFPGFGLTSETSWRWLGGSELS